jgi:hypothetical protein
MNFMTLPYRQRCGSHGRLERGFLRGVFAIHGAVVKHSPLVANWHNGVLGKSHFSLRCKRLSDYFLSGSFGRTVLLDSGILSLPPSPLSSRPPEVDVPLPLRLGFVALPVVGAEPGVAELAAGSPVVDPEPLGAPPVCASASVEHSASPKANAIGVSFIATILTRSTKLIGQERERSQRAVRDA